MSEPLLETRVLVLAPTRIDGETTARVLGEAGIAIELCGSEADLVHEIRRGAGAVLLTDESSHREPLHDIRFLLDLQPSWSELPILVLARADSPHVQLLRTAPGMVLLERPVHIRSLVSAIEAALRARMRQYELRNQLDHTRAVNRELENSARAKDDFLATLSHELRNPLSALTTAADLLDRDDLPAGSMKSARQIVKRQAMQMARLLDDLLDVARITHGRLTIKKTRTALLPVVRAAVEAVQPIIARKKHEFVTKLPDEDSMLDVDPVRMSQIITNLLTNAAKYTEDGGHIELEVSRAPESIRIRVRDDGIGIDLESRAEIFGMFSQLRPAIERSEGGLGIGLALTKGLVELHGGKIDVQSAGIGCGSEFVVTIPARLRATDAGPVRDEPAVSAGQSCDLIIADDNSDALSALATMLELEGHVVRMAPDGTTAIALFKAREPTALLLDIGMPGMNGYEVARQVRLLAPRSPVALLALTGWGQASDRRLAIDAGFDHHLTKPVDIDELLALLSRISAGNQGKPATSRLAVPNRAD